VRDLRSEDELLIGRFQGGDREAFDRLMRAHVDRVFALAWSVLRNREDAMDASQEVFVRLYRHLPKFTASDNLNAWLYRVCLNQCIDLKRRAKLRPISAISDEEIERLRGYPDEEPEFRAYQTENGRMIAEAVDALPNRQRTVFVLRHYRLMSLNEIAETIGCSTGAVKTHLSRATASLRTRLAGLVMREQHGGRPK